MSAYQQYLLLVIAEGQVTSKLPFVKKFHFALFSLL